MKYKFIPIRFAKVSGNSQISGTSLNHSTVFARSLSSAQDIDAIVRSTPAINVLESNRTLLLSLRHILSTFPNDDSVIKIVVLTILLTIGAVRSIRPIIDSIHNLVCFGAEALLVIRQSNQILISELTRLAIVIVRQHDWREK